MNDSGQSTDLLITLMTITRLQVPLVTTSLKLLQIKQHIMIVTNLPVSRLQQLLLAATKLQAKQAYYVGLFYFILFYLFYFIFLNPQFHIRNSINVYIHSP